VGAARQFPEGDVTTCSCDALGGTTTEEGRAIRQWPKQDICGKDRPAPPVFLVGFRSLSDVRAPAREFLIEVRLKRLSPPRIGPSAELLDNVAILLA